MSGVTFDAGGLIALDRNDRRVLALVARAAERGLKTPREVAPIATEAYPTPAPRPP